MMRWYSDPKYVKVTPVLTTILLEFANVCHLWKMWTNHTSAGQNVWGWLSVNLALLLWINWYRVFTPKERFAIWSCVVGMCINFGVIGTVLYFS